MSFGTPGQYSRKNSSQKMLTSSYVGEKFAKLFMKTDSLRTAGKEHLLKAAEHLKAAEQLRKEADAELELL